MAALLTVKHNIEVAHRLSLTPGKCENIHGHSMEVELSIRGHLDPVSGMIMSGFYERSQEHGWLRYPIEFGKLKEAFRDELDSELDHRLLLNGADPLLEDGAPALPGLQVFPGDPTTENIAKWIYDWTKQQYWLVGNPEQGAQLNLHVTVYETKVNSATYGDF